MNMNREQWLTELAKRAEGLFDGLEFPAYRVACSWPSRSALSKKSRRIGECWPADSSGDNTVEMIISMGIDDALEVAATLVHEMVHCVVGNEHGHKGPFKRVATAVGLEGKMTATHAGTELTERLNAFMDDMPPYPHAKIDAMQSGRKKQGTRMLKAECECGYTVRLARKWADIGTPICPQCNVNMILDEGV